MNLLDPRARDRFIRAYAFLEAEYSRGRRSAVTCLLPFLNEAAASFHGKPLDQNELAQFVKKHYRIEIPLYMFDLLVPAMRTAGSLVRHTGTSTYYCDRRAATANNPTTDIGLDQSDIQHLEDSLSAFASSQTKYDSPLTASTWGEALINFLQNYTLSTQKAQQVKGVIVGNPQHIDNWIISEFIQSENHVDSHLFPIIRRLYYGVLISDFLITLQMDSSETDFSNLTVIYDTTVLLRLLGTSGKTLQIATQEVHDALLHLNCNTSYFPHLYDEAIEILNGIISAYDTKTYQYLLEETQEALVNREISIDTIRMLPGQLDIELGKRYLNEAPDPSEANRKAYIDEHKFEQLLAGSRSRSTTRRDERDALSLGLIMRHRQQHLSKDLADSRYILITHNRDFARLARGFIQDTENAQKHHIPPVLDLATIAAATFFADGATDLNAKIDAQLAAACYTAHLPSPEWEAAFWKRLSDAEESSDEAKRLIHSHTVVTGLREALREETFGYPSLLRPVDMLARLHEYQERAEEEQQKRDEETALSARARGRIEIYEATEQRIINATHNGLRYGSGILAILFAALAIVPDFAAAAKPYLPALVILSGRVVLGVLAGCSVFSLFGLIRGPRWHIAAEKIGRCIWRILAGQAPDPPLPEKDDR